MKRLLRAVRPATWLLTGLLFAAMSGEAQVINLAFSVSSGTVDEQSVLAIDIVRTGDQGEVGVDVEIAGGTALEGADFQLDPPAGTCGKDVCFSASDATKTVLVQGFDDDLAEGTETIQLQLANPFAPAASVTLLSPSSLTIDLLDAGACQFELDTFAGSEELEEVFVTVLRAGGSAGSKTCRFDTVDGSPPNGAVAPADYTAVSGQLLTWGAGDDSSRSVVLEIVDDDEPEELETLGLELSPPVVPASRAGRLASAGGLPALLDTATATIADNDVSSRFSFVSPLIEAKEVDGRALIAIERSGDVTKAASIDIVLGIGAAREGVDFEVPDKTARWAPGVGGVATVEVLLIRDSLKELTESVVISLGEPRETPVGPPFPLLGDLTETILTIEDLSATRQVHFTANLFATSELEGFATVSVERTGTPAGRVSVSLCQDSRSTADAADFTLLEPTTSWPEGELGTRSLSIRIIDDDETEGPELIDLFLCGVIGAELDEPQRATVVIADDDLPIGPEIEITALAGAEHPAVAYDHNGRKIVVWQSPDGDGNGIFARLFDGDGSALGPPFRVNEETGGDQSQPNVSFDADGRFVIVFAAGPSAAGAGALQSTGIVARAFDANGAATATATVIASSDAAAPDVASDKDGDATVVWEEDGRTRARVLGPGGAIGSGELEVDESGGCRPAAATAASGDAVVVWIESSCADGPGSALTASASRASGEVWMRRYDDRGAARGPAVRVADGAGIATAAVAVDDEGRVVVTWEAESAAGDLDVYARLYAADGTSLGPAFVVNEERAGNQHQPRVDANAVFDLAFVWLDDSPAGDGPTAIAGDGVTARLYDGSGRASSGDLTVTAADALTEPANPDISIENGDQTTVVWERRRRDDGESLGIASRTLSPRLADGSCTTSETDLCLERSRFRVEVEWQAFDGSSGAGIAEALTSETGYFWFFDDGNVEVVLKVLDGCAINGHFWVFATGLTNVEVNVRVDDVLSGRTVSYFSSLGAGFAPILDTTAFPSCDLQLPAGRSADP